MKALDDYLREKHQIPTLTIPASAKRYKYCTVNGTKYYRPESSRPTEQKKTTPSPKSRVTTKQSNYKVILSLVVAYPL
jgi:hypothetical protein